MQVDVQEQHSGEAESRFTAVELLTIFAARKWFLLRCILGAGLLLVVYSYTMKPTYTVMVTLLPPEQESSLASTLMASQAGALGSLGSSALGLKSPIDQDIYVMKSASVEDAVIQRFGLMQEFHATRLSDTRTLLGNMVKIESNTKAGVIELSVTHKDPREAAALANGYVEEYQKKTATLATGEASKRRLFFEQQLAQEKQNLSQAEENLKRTEQTTGVMEMDSEARATLQTVTQLRAQIAAKEVQISSLKTFAAEGNPELIQAEQELSSLRGQLGRMANGAGEDDLLLPKGRLPQVGLEYVRSLREVKYHETLFEILAKQYGAAKLDEAREGAGIQVIDAGKVPDQKSAPTRSRYLAVGLGLGLFFGSLYIVLQAGIFGDQQTAQRLSQLRKAVFQMRDTRPEVFHNGRISGVS